MSVEMKKVIAFRVEGDKRTPRDKLNALVDSWNGFSGKPDIESTRMQMKAVSKLANNLILEYPELVGEAIHVACYPVGFEFLTCNF